MATPNAYDFTIRGDIAFVINDVVEVYTTGDDGRLIGSFDEQDLGLYPERIHAVGDYILMIGDGKIATFTIPSNPMSATAVAGSQTTIEKIDDLLFLSSAQFGIKSFESSNVVDVSDPLRPEWVSQIPFGYETNARFAPSPVPGLIYAAERVGGIHVFDYTDPTNPIQTALYQTAPKGTNNRGPTDIEIAGDFAFVSDRHYGLIVYQVNQDASLTRITELDLPAPMLLIHVLGDIAMLSSATNAYLVDISNPSAPTLLSTIEGLANQTPKINRAVRDGDLLYTGEIDNGYRIFDISDATAPQEIAQFDVNVVPKTGIDYGDLVYDIQLEENLLYISLSNGGFAVFDNSNFLNPVLIEHIPARVSNNGIEVRYRQFVKENNTIYIAAGISGVHTLSLNGCPLPCAADFNGDGNFNYFDVAFFIEAFLMSYPVADINGDGLFNFFDVFEFIAASQAGCP